MRLIVRPASSLHGEIAVPGDKSIAHRLLLLAASGRGASRIRGLPASHDVRSSAACLLRLGDQPGLERWLQGRGRGTVRVAGRGFDGLRQPPLPLDCGNSGTTMRLLAGLLAGRPFDSALDGDDSLRARPMERVAAPLRAMGARVDTEDGHAPVTIAGGGLRGVDHRPGSPSAQVRGALLLAGMQAEGSTVIEPAGGGRDHTERLLAALGAPLALREDGVELRGPHQHRGFRARVPGDPSSAAFVLAAAAMCEGASVSIRGVSTNPTRLGFLDVLRRAGADVVVRTAGRSLGEPFGTIAVRGGPLAPFEVGADELPAVIDEVPVLAAVAARAPGRSGFHGAGELRVKESDRLEGIAAGLRDLGGDAAAHGDSLVVHGGTLRGGEADGRGDHRLVMALVVAALGADGASGIAGAEAVDVSFPGFAHALRTVGAPVAEEEE